MSRALKRSVANEESPSPGFGGISVGVWASLLAVYVIWGSTYLAIRIAVEGLPPLLMSGVRFSIAGTCLFLFLRFRGARVPSRAEWAGAAVVGACLLAGGNGAVAIAETHVSSSVTAMMIATTPLWAALFAGLLGRWPRLLEWVGLGIGFAGVVLLNLQGSLRANPVAAATLLFASASWAFGSIISRRVRLPEGMMGSAAEMIVGGVLLVAVGVVRREHVSHAFPLHSVLAMAYLVLVGSLIAYSAYTYLLRHARPTLATSYAYVNPIVAVLLGVGLVGEHIAPIGILALFVIITGVVIVVLTREQE